MRMTSSHLSVVVMMVAAALSSGVHAAGASSCSIFATSLSMNAIEQVRVSLGEYDSKVKKWNVVVSFAASREAMRPHNNGTGYRPVVRVADCFGESETEKMPSSSCCSMQYVGRTTSYEYNVDDHLKKVGYTIHDHYNSPWLYHVPIKAAVSAEGKMFYGVGLVTVGPTGEPTADSSHDLFRDSIFGFSAPPAPGMMNLKDVGVPGKEAEHPVRLCVIGDIGQTQYSMKTRDVILAQLDGTGGGSGGAGASIPPPSLAMIVGDMSYADGGAQRWDSWGRMMEPLASKISVMVLVGNHEIEMDNVTHESFEHYRHRFIMPDGGRPEYKSPMMKRNRKHYGMSMRYQGGSSYYSVDVGPFHLIALNTYDTAWHFSDDGAVPNLQKEFFESDLLKYDTPEQRKITPFIIVFMHAPYYNSNEGHQNELATAYLREWAEPLILKHHVDAVFAGHVHAYERFRGVGPQGTSVARDDNAPIYVTIGDGGNHELFYDTWLAKPAASAYRNADHYGHGDLVAWNKTHLEWVWRPNPEQGAEAKKTIDRAWISPRSARILNKDGPTLGMTGWQYLSIFILIVCGISLVSYLILHFVRKKPVLSSLNPSEAPALGLGKDRGNVFTRIDDIDTNRLVPDGEMDSSQFTEVMALTDSAQDLA